MTDKMTDIDTLIIGAGQAGIAMSEHLNRQDVPHLVIEKNRIAEAWRSGRWDSLVANGPAWHDRFPSMLFPDDIDPESFVPKDFVADYFNAYVEKFNLPVTTGVEVLSVSRNNNGSGFIVETTQGTIKTQRVVSATGAFQIPVIPEIAPKDPELHQIHSAAYHNPEQLPEGAVMVVGAGSSGVQIADELQRSGREVYLSVGPHDRPPRSYRGRDFVWWLGVLGLWDAAATEPGKEHVTIAVSGAHEGITIDFRQLAKQGLNLVGRTESFDNGVVHFNNDLADNIRAGDDNYLSLLDLADDYVTRNNLNLPEEPKARELLADPESMTHPTLELNLKAAGITSIIWSTGYATDYSWLKVDALDEKKQPKHHRGVSTESGIYFLGLPWQSRRGSSFIWGVWHDAKYIADQILIQRQYQQYNDEH